MLLGYVKLFWSWQTCTAVSGGEAYLLGTRDNYLGLPKNGNQVHLYEACVVGAAGPQRQLQYNTYMLKICISFILLLLALIEALGPTVALLEL